VGSGTEKNASGNTQAGTVTRILCGLLTTAFSPSRRGWFTENR
jgi:hypothetical protein